MMAPRKGDQDKAGQLYHLVSNSLPMEITIRGGLEQFLPIEVLCLTRNQVHNFGF